MIEADSLTTIDCTPAFFPKGSETMRINHWRLVLCLGFVLAAALSLACSSSDSTESATSIRLSKEKSADKEVSTFAAHDTVYAVVVVSKGEKASVRGRLLVDNVPGQQAGPIPGLENTQEAPGSATFTFTFTPPPDGWPAGTYKVEATITTGDNQQQEQKTASFTVTG